MLIVLLGLCTPFWSVDGIGLHRVDAMSAGGGDNVYQGWQIDSIAIDSRNIYDLTDERYSGFLFRTANRLHVVTRNQIIRQELLFAVGDTVSQELVAETARNLRLRFPFNDAWIEIEEVAPGRALVRVVTIDQWSLIGGLRSIDRDGNETNLRIGFEERNLIGRAQFISFDYYARENDPNYVTAVYREPRVFGRPLALSLAFRTDPFYKLRRVGISRPFYSLAQSLSFELRAAKTTVREQRFDSQGDTVSQWTGTGEVIELTADLRGGPSHRKISFHSGYKYVYKRIRDTVSYTDAIPVDARFAVDSVYHRFSLGLSYVIQTFVEERRLRGFDYTEDIALGLGLKGGYGRAFYPDFRNHYFDLADAGVTWKQRLGNNIVGAEYLTSIWFKGTDEIRRQYGLSFSLHNNRLPFVTFAVRSLFLSDRGGEHLNLILGGKNGLRGYPKEFRAGDRSHVVNVESRFFPGLELLSVKIGSALFVDMGQAWQRDEPLAIRDYHLSGGAGLRLSLENLLRGEIIRIDAVLAEGGAWEVSFGTGQYF